MFCTHCGAARVEGNAFCASCGIRFADPVGSAPSTPEQVEGPAPPPRTGDRTKLVVAAALVLLLVVVGGAAVLLRVNHGSATGGGAASNAAAPPPPIRSVSPSPTLSPTPSPTSTQQDFPTLYQHDAGGVVRIETTACDGGGVGSGFLVAPDLVATVAHVVNGAVSVVVRDGATTTTGTVVGVDPQAELALVRTSVPLSGHVFSLDPAQPKVGTDIAAIGYPLGGQRSLTKGSVSGLGRTIDVEDLHLTGLIQTDTAINPGNSGGPLLTADGTVVGLVEAERVDAQNIGYAIPASAATGPIQGWRADPTPVHTGVDCADPTGPSGLTAHVTDRSGSPDGAAVARTFATYADGINTGDYESAYSVLSQNAQAATSYEKFSRGEASSYLVGVVIREVTPSGASARADVTFTSVQESALGPHGQSCSIWHLTYTMVRSQGTWLIDRADNQPGSPAAC